MLKPKLSFKGFVQEIIEGKRTGLFPQVLKCLLAFASFFWAIAVFLKSFFYKPHQVDAVVVSVGNIVAGGTGKTPLILLLANELMKMGKRVAVLSRGYLSEAENKEPLLACDQNGPLFSWKKIGDEPILIAKRLPHLLLYVGKDRVNSAKQAIQKGAEVILLDDGFQYRKLARDFDLVVLNAKNPFGFGHFLPWGYLRESPKGLKKAHYLVGNPIQDAKDAQNLEKELQKFTVAPLIGVMPSSYQIKTLAGDVLHSLEGISVGMFCGIARPEGFRKALLTLKAKIVAEYCVSDHAEIPPSALEEFAVYSKSKGAKYLICTEKDAVKLEQAKNYSLPLLFVQMDFQIVYGEEHWKNLVEKIARKVR